MYDTQQERIYTFGANEEDARRYAEHVRVGDSPMGIPIHGLLKYFQGSMTHELRTIQNLEPGGHFEDLDGFHWVRAI